MTLPDPPPPDPPRPDRKDPHVPEEDQGPNKHVNFSSCKLFKMKMVVRMISGNITIPQHPPHASGGGAWGAGWGTVMFPEIILTTIFILNSLGEPKFTCLMWALTSRDFAHPTDPLS